MSTPKPSSLFFAGMKQKHIDLLHETWTHAEFGSGDVIFQPGGPANSFHLIEHGMVALEADMDGAGLVQIANLKDGEPLGWSWLFPPYMWHFHARALKRTTTTYFDVKRLRQMCDEDPEFGYELLKRVSQVMLERFQSTQGELLKLYVERERGPD